MDIELEKLIAYAPSEEDFTEDLYSQKTKFHDYDSSEWEKEINVISDFYGHSQKNFLKKTFGTFVVGLKGYPDLPSSFLGNSLYERTHSWIELQKVQRYIPEYHYQPNIIDIKDFTGEVVEVTEELVVLNLLIDPTEEDYEKRGFPIEPIEQMGLATVGELIQVSTILSKGSILFYFSKGDKKNYKNSSKEELFMRIADTNLFKKLQNG